MAPLAGRALTLLRERERLNFVGGTVNCHLVGLLNVLTHNTESVYAFMLLLKQ